MKNLLVVVDMQNDFVDGALGTPEAQAILPRVKTRIQAAEAAGEDVVFTRDTHSAVYLETQEGKKLPVEHCIKGTHGWEIVPQLAPFVKTVFDKPTFGSVELAHYIADSDYKNITFIGLCTDICVISNALLAKAFVPECVVTVEAACCAGVTPESHQTALRAMEMCQVEIV